VVVLVELLFTLILLLILRHVLQEFKRKSSMEAELRCLRAVGTMEERLRNACNAPEATFSSVIKVCYGLIFQFLDMYDFVYTAGSMVQSNVSSSVSRVSDISFSFPGSGRVGD